ncbi:hypothetical protein ABIA39_008902 [Nocardia sp. GAS34]
MSLIAGSSSILAGVIASVPATGHRPTYTTTEAWIGSAIFLLVLLALTVWVLNSGRRENSRPRRAPRRRFRRK